MGAADVSAFEDRLRSWAHQVVAAAAPAIASAIASDDAPYREEGSIRDALEVEQVIGHATGAEAIIAARVATARWTDEGTDPHPIVPVRARVLRFETGGQVVFTKHVNHPGNRPFNWWRPALEWHGAEQLARYARSIPV